MTARTTPRKLFVNLPVRDLKASVEFFTKLGFGFNAQFTDDSATCMILSEEAFVMLLVEPRFKDFVRKPIADARGATAGIYCFSATSREEVDTLADAALAAGGTAASDAMDHGFMYVRSFYDLDGHHWEVAWMDPSGAPPAP